MLPEFEQMSKHVTLFDQMEEETGPIVLVNKITVAPEEASKVPQAWASDSGIMKRQPGFISAQLHEGVAGSGVFLTYAIWESMEDFKNAFQNPEFRAAVKGFPESTVFSPHAFRMVAVPGICLGLEGPGK